MICISALLVLLCLSAALFSNTVNSANGFSDQLSVHNRIVWDHSTRRPSIAPVITDEQVKHPKVRKSVKKPSVSKSDSSKNSNTQYPLGKALKQLPPQNGPLPPLLLDSVDDYPLSGNYACRGKIETRSPSSFGASVSMRTYPNRLRLIDLYSFLKANFKTTTLMITICDKGYANTFKLFYRLSHMERYSNFVAFVMDKEGFDLLSKEGYPVFYYKNDLLSQSEASRSTRMWTSSAFNKMVLKLCVIRDLLLLKYSVLYMDSDVILFKDPLPALQQYTQYDFVAQRDDEICAGFMFIQPTRASYTMITVATTLMYMRRIMDQDAIIAYTQKKGRVNYTFLPSAQFMSGRDYATTHQFADDHCPSDANIISYHNNYVIHESNKLYRWREQGLFTDDHGYYARDPAGYVLLDLLPDNYLTAFNVLAELVNRLNRTLILPTVACPRGVNRTRCNICAIDDTCCYNFQRMIHFRFRARQILQDARAPAALLEEYKNGPTFSYAMSQTGAPYVKENTIYVTEKCTLRDLFPLPRSTVLFHIANLPPCITVTQPKPYRGD